ncbi:hypothetical protein E4634_04800 [Mangrovimicrobium sediminis]|uniref:Uncharacterized protein n=1 Tax=Mangrovimicrobium sediminis TaxID=2562682 RepID=A0A4Z0M6M3_9GAMM|nr:hypothetical protein [Haliea sp. SAOS-164]TGD75313.1 hypothetical protein E4634_04800 [Haliea sp. SAOS-164]
MIISLDVLSEDHVHRIYRHYPRAIYGLAFAYAAWDEYCSYLAQAEDLFITASAAGNGRLIGHPQGEPSFTPQALADWLRESVLPFEYFGDLYIAAPGADRSYLDGLRKAMGPRYEGRIFGQFGLPSGTLQPPVEAHWVEAA